MKKEIKRVSIICAAHNEGATFEKHLQSLADQTYNNFEVIVVNDGSTDNTGEIGKKFAKKYKNFSYYEIKNIPGCGCVRPRLEGIKHVTGDILSWVDADAYYDKDYYKICIEKLYSDMKIGAIVPRMFFWDPCTFVSKYKSLLIELRYRNPEQIVREIKNAIHSPWVIRKEVYEAVGGFHVTWAYIEDVYLARNIMDSGYEMVYEPKAKWYHKLEEESWDVMRKNFEIGRMYSTEFNVRDKTWLKVSYFTLPFLAIIAGFVFNPWFFLFLPLHSVPMLIKGVSLFFEAAKFGIKKERWHALYSIPVSYIVNIPNMLGFYYGFIRPYDKSEIKKPVPREFVKKQASL